MGTYKNKRFDVARMRERWNLRLTALMCLPSLNQLYQVISWPQIRTFYRPHIFATRPKHAMVHVTGILECVNFEDLEDIWDTNSSQQAMFWSKSVCDMCMTIWVGDKIYIFALPWSSFEKCWLTKLKTWGVVPLAPGGGPAPRNSWEAVVGHQLDLQVSKWPWVMGVPDCTCSWLITVITLHRHCTLVHSSSVITGPGNHVGGQPPPLATSCQTLFYQPVGSIWSPPHTLFVQDWVGLVWKGSLISCPSPMQWQITAQPCQTVEDHGFSTYL